MALCTAAPKWSAGSTHGIQISVHADGCYSLNVHGSPWLVSAGTELRLDGSWLTSEDESLTIESSSSSHGTDAVGTYTAFSLRWSAARWSTLNFTTTFALYDGTLSQPHQMITFTQDIGAGTPLTGIGIPNATSWGTPASGFPTFDSTGRAKLGGASGLGYVSYGEIGMPRVGRFPTGYKSGAIEYDGVPLMLLDEASTTAAILAPTTGFYDNVYAHVGTGYLRCGAAGTWSAPLAEGISLQTALFVSGRAHGATPAWLGFGEALRRRYAKPHPPPTASKQIERLGYSTVGHYFYGRARGRTMAQTLSQVKSAAEGGKLPPFGYYLIDSFWYAESFLPKRGGGYTSGYDGTWRWDDIVARQNDMFPSGLRALRQELGAPFAMHMGMWVGRDSPAKRAPPYADNHSYEWTIEETASIPTPGTAGSRRFWEWLFSSMAAVGLQVYKLDHSQQQVPQTRYLLETPGAAATWMREMASAAAKHNITKQYGGHISSGFLHSAMLPNALTARVGPDYIPGLHRPQNACTVDGGATSPKGNVLIGKNTLYPWAVGLRPYKDAFLSGKQRWHHTTCFLGPRSSPATGRGITAPEWWGLQEAYPELHVLVSSLTAGPVAVGDGIGDTDVTLVSRTCRADGVLLTPDRPAFAIDATWLYEAFGRGGPDGEVTATFSRVGMYTWRFVLGVALLSPFAVTEADLAHDGSGGGEERFGVAWKRSFGDPFAPPRRSDLVRFGASSPMSLELPAAASEDSWGVYTLWRTAPISCDGGGFALLGEMAKLVSLSSQRVASVSPSCSSSPAMDVSLIGAPGEVVSISFMEPSGGVITRSATIASNGTAHVHVSSSAVGGGRISCADPTDCTAVLQAALDDTTISSITIPSTGAPWQVQPLFIRRSNLLVRFETGAVLEAKAGSFEGTNDCLIEIVSAENVTLLLQGAALRMRRPYLPPRYKKAEWRHVLSIRGSSNVRVDGGTGGELSDSGGDGIMIAGASHATNFSTNVTLRGLRVVRAWRNGLSVISAKNLLVEDCDFDETSGTNPQFGIDLEPDANPFGYLVNLTFRRIRLRNNVNGGFTMGLYGLVGEPGAEMVSVVVEGMVISGSCGVAPYNVSHRGVGLQLSNYPLGIKNGSVARGHMTFRDVSIDNVTASGVDFESWVRHHISVTFDNLTIGRDVASQSQYWPGHPLAGPPVPIALGPYDTNASHRVGGIYFGPRPVRVDMSTLPPGPPSRSWLSALYNTSAGMADVNGVAVVTTHDRRMCDAQLGHQPINVSIHVDCHVIAPTAGTPNSTAIWRDHRKKLITAVRGVGHLPTRSKPDWTVDNIAPGVTGLIWNLSHGLFDINSTVFYSPLSGDLTKPSTEAFLFHHGHTNCIECPGGNSGYSKCFPGCKSPTNVDGTWWDLYNVSAFFHSIGYDVFIISMPLKGVNVGPGSNATYLNTNHWWFEQWEARGDHPMSYFLDDVFLTANFATEQLGVRRLYMAGLSGGGWTTTFAAAMDPRIIGSFPIAGSIPCAMRDPDGKSWPVGNDQEDYEQNCSPNPNPTNPPHPGRPAFQACNYTCQYLLAGLEPERWQVQMLHERDSCCFATIGRHDQMRRYETSIRAELQSAGRATSGHGWFTVTADNHTKHEVCDRDKATIATVMKAGGYAPAASSWEELPCDIIHKAQGPSCPADGPPPLPAEDHAMVQRGS